MKKIIIVCMCSISILSCKKSGSEGGNNVVQSPAITFYEGSISSNEQVVSLPVLKNNSNVDVYAYMNGKYTPLPYTYNYVDTIIHDTYTEYRNASVTATFTINGKDVTLINCQLVGIKKYKISVTG